MPEQSTHWDRSAELRQIESTYAEYDRLGRERLWNERSRGFGRLVSELRNRVLDELNRSTGGRAATVLDLGCGTGDLASHASSAGLQLSWTGLDLRPDAIDIARTRNPTADFLVGSADEIPLPDESVDVVVAQVLFSSLPSTSLEQAVASDVGRVLRSGGWLIWMDMRYSNPSNDAVHGLSRQRIEGLFPGWRAELTTAGLIPALARALGRSAPVTYPILTRVPFLRSHIVGRLLRPANPSTL